MEQPQTQNNAAGGLSAVDRCVMRDWQITAILPNDMLVETDCNSGEKRTLRKSACSCGQPVLIEYNARSCVLVDRRVRGSGGTKHICDKGTDAKRRDVVYTPDSVAAAIVQRYNPTGMVLDPCKGDGAFWRHMPGAEWCEIAEGRDFFDWRAPVDWIVGNPPYSVMNRWLEHSFSIADNVVYLIPVAKVFGSLMRLRMIAEYGGVAEVWAPWTGRAIGFKFGWAVGAVHFKRGHVGGTVFDIVAPNKELSS